MRVAALPIVLSALLLAGCGFVGSGDGVCGSDLDPDSAACVDYQEPALPGEPGYEGPEDDLSVTMRPEPCDDPELQMEELLQDALGQGGARLTCP